MDVFQGAGSQQRAFDASDEGSVVFASDHGKAKQYHVCADHDALYACVYAQPPEKRCFYEMVRADAPLKLYFDLDLKGDDQVKDRMDAIQLALIAFVNLKLATAHQRVVGADDVLVLNSDGDGKASRHLIWPVYFEDVAHVKAFVHRNVVPHFPDAVDKGVYTKNRCFRLFGNRKLGSERVLKSGRSDGSEGTQRRLFQQALLTLPPPPETTLLRSDGVGAVVPSKRKRSASRDAPDLDHDAIDPVTAWVAALIREQEDVANPTVTRVRGSVHTLRFLRTKHKKVCRLGGTHEHQNLAVNVDVHTGAVWYKCFGTSGHPLDDDGDPTQHLRLADLPPALRTTLTPDNAPDAKWLLDEAEYGDTGFARVYLKTYADEHLVCTAPNGDGYVWNLESRLWETTTHQALVVEMAKTLQRLYAPLKEHVEEKLGKPRWARIWGVVSSIRALYGPMQVVTCDRYDPLFHSKLDASPWELPLKGGDVVDMRTLDVRPRNTSDYWSWESLATYLPDHPCNVAMDFFREVTDLDAHPERVGYDRCLQTCVGALLCGDVGAKILPVWHGRSGNNSKSTLADLLEACVPGCFTAISATVLSQLSNRGAGPSPEIMQIVGKRVCVLGDTGKSMCLDEANVKTITGGDMISARACHGACINFRATCKPLLITNRNATFDVQQKAMKDRFHYFPFTRQFRKCKRNTDKIKAFQHTHLDQFFTAFLRGAKDYADNMELRTCPWLELERARYIDSINPVGSFVDECCVKDVGARGSCASLYEGYTHWCQRNGDRWKSKKWFGSQMTMLFGGTISARVDGAIVRAYIDVRLK